MGNRQASQSNSDFGVFRGTEPHSNREDIVRISSVSVEPLIEEYFAIPPQEKILVDDTDRSTVPGAGYLYCIECDRF